MKDLRFSFLPPGATEPYDRVHISMSETDTGFLFKCEEVNTECAHPLVQEDTSKFLDALGTPSGADAFEAVRHLVATGREIDVHAAIHESLRASFVWTSTNWE